MMCTRKVLLGAAVSLLMAACPSPKDTTKPDNNGGGGGNPAATAASAGLQGAVSGRVTFTQADGKVKVRLDLSGAPAGDHGVHIHEKGECAAPDFKSAGGHFNPAGVVHGAPASMPHHPGDFGNVTVGADGNGTLELETDQLTVSAGPVSVVGRAIIIHEKADDLTTQPTGNAGGRIGCGVIAAQ